MASDADKLIEYRKKRDPRVTNEPFSTAAAGESGERQTFAGDFVVHLHAATRRHYDLRIQVGPTLKSFAVPRGPSLSPSDKRLAVQTEDHPIEYLDFEDIIPEGNYGAGPMIVWDIGRVRYLENSAEVGIQKRKIDFELHGRKLRGRFALVDTSGRGKEPEPKQRQWLLLKKADLHSSDDGEKLIREHPESVLSGLCVEQLAEREQLEQSLVGEAKTLGASLGSVDFARAVPMLCALDGAELDDVERLYELKLDGVRILAERKNKETRLRYRKGRAATHSYPEITRAVGTLFARDFVIDGEIVSFDENGKPNFQRLAKRIHAARPFDVKRAVAEIPVVYLAFDLLKLGPYDLRALPLRERKRLLAKLLAGRGLVRLLDHIEGNGQALFDLCRAQGLEGVVSKRAGDSYRFGPVRGVSWVKHKCEREDDFVVVGWVQGNGSRKLGALDLATYSGERLVYRGRVGSGISASTETQLLELMAACASAVWRAHGEPLVETGVRHFVEPKLVVNIRYLQWTDEGRVRMAVFKGLRDDLDLADCRAAPTDERVEAALSAGSPESESSNEETSPAVAVPVRRVKLKNQDKVFWPEEGYTKGELLDYYEQIAPALLPHLVDRPVMLVRHPDGIAGKSFYQWNIPAGTPNWVKTLELRYEERDGKNVSTFLVDDVDSLLHIVNLGCIPVHVLASRRQHLDACDFLTIDFDLGEQPFREAVLLALSLKELLGELGLVGFPKTSGQSGLHVIVPMGLGVQFPVAKVLVELLGRLLQLRHPETSTMQRRVSERGGKVYIDTGQTGRSRTIVSPYSVRAYRGARVSTPLLWEEVHLALKPEELTMFTVPERVARKGDPMASLLDVQPDVLTAVKKLEGMVRR